MRLRITFSTAISETIDVAPGDAVYAEKKFSQREVFALTTLEKTAEWGGTPSRVLRLNSDHIVAMEALDPYE